ncbi:acyltransferase [Sphingomonas sp. ST-64]|uniref:Acyltransferase n=1 Tax=Sphingomonas plantiphila TaxID=3163295 RepID=A0ABW8YJT5_9SPHN
MPEAETPESTRPAWVYMDATRAALALTVAFGHLWGLLIEDYRPTGSLLIRAGYFLAGFAHSAVILFFVLSGYWIARSVTGRVARGWRWDDYLIDRIARLGVVLLPALAIGGVLDWVAFHWLALPTHRGLTGAWVFTQDLNVSLTPGALLGNVLFLQHLIVPPFGSNGPLWSLAYEFWYYLWFPALYLSFRTKRPSLALPVLAMGLVSPGLTFGFLSWMCGAALHFAEERARARAWRLSGWSPIVAGLVCAGVLLWGRTGDFSIEDPLEAAAFAMFLFTLLRTAPPVLSILRPAASYGARASFSLYAIHFPVMAIIAGSIVGAQRLAPTATTGLAVAAILIVVAGIAWLFAMSTEARTTAARAALRARLADRRPV